MVHFLKHVKIDALRNSNGLKYKQRPEVENKSIDLFFLSAFLICRTVCRTGGEISKLNMFSVVLF